MSRFIVGPTTVIGSLTPGFLEFTKPGDAQVLTTFIFMHNFLMGQWTCSLSVTPRCETLNVLSLLGLDRAYQETAGCPEPTHVV